MDRNGFQVIKETTSGPQSMVDCITFEEYTDGRKVKEVVIPAVESFLKRNIAGAEDVIAFSTQVSETSWYLPLLLIVILTYAYIRRRDPLFPRLSRGTDGNRPQPVQGVHVGQSQETDDRFQLQHADSF